MTPAVPLIGMLRPQAVVSKSQASTNDNQDLREVEADELHDNGESRIRCRLDWEMMDFFEDTVILNKDRLLKDYEQLTVKEIQDKDKSNVLQLLRTFRKAVQVPANLLTSSKPLKVRVHFANAHSHFFAGESSTL